MQTKDKILEIAFINFLDKGFEGVSLNEIIKQTEMTKGAFYHHFENKEALLSEVLRKYFHRYIQLSIDDFSKMEGDIVEKIGYVINSMITLKDKIKDLSPDKTSIGAFLSLMQEGIKRDSNLRNAYEKSQKKATLTIQELFEKGQVVGKIRSDMKAMDMALLLNATLKGSMFESIILNNQTLDETINKNVENLLDMFFI